MENHMPNYIVIPDEKTIRPDNRQSFIGIVRTGTLNEDGYQWLGDIDYQKEIVFLERYFGKLLRFHGVRGKPKSIEVHPGIAAKYPDEVVAGLDALLIGKDGLGSALLLPTDSERIEFGYALLQESAQKVLDTKLEHLFPILAGKGREWDYNPLIMARMNMGLVHDCYRGMQGNPKADTLMEKTKAHLDMLQREWDKAGYLKSNI